MKVTHVFRIAAIFAILFAAATTLVAQTDAELGEAAVKAITYFQNQQYTEAIPHFEVLLKAMPDEGKLHFLYGFCLVAKSKQVSDATQGKQLSEKALEEFKSAKRLGYNDPANDSLIKMLSGDTSSTAPQGLSSGSEAEKLVDEGENFFVQSKYDEAIKKFEKALELDPKLYQAALSGGDCYTLKGDWENAEKWYQKAIAIDPDRETAYRYSATPLMKQKKFDAARERYIEAYITEPYGGMSTRGISQWAAVTGAKLGHPKVDFPEVSFDPSGAAILKSPIKPEDQESKPWLAYVSVRESWKKEKFTKANPDRKSYHHSLQEELEAIRAAVSAAREQKSKASHFELLGRMDSEGVLEAFIFLARPDDDIAAEYAAYLKSNRPKLRKYVADYVIQK